MTAMLKFQVRQIAWGGALAASIAASTAAAQSGVIVGWAGSVDAAPAAQTQPVSSVAASASQEAAPRRRLIGVSPARVRGGSSSSSPAAPSPSVATRRPPPTTSAAAPSISIAAPVRAPFVAAPAPSISISAPSARAASVAAPAAPAYEILSLDEIPFAPEPSTAPAAVQIVNTPPRPAPRAVQRTAQTGSAQIRSGDSAASFGAPSRRPIVQPAPRRAPIAYAAPPAPDSGDGRYGPSVIDTGYGAAAQETVLMVSKAAVVRLPAPARDVIVSDPEVVRAILRTNQQLVLIGAKLGQTNIFVFDEGGDQILNLQARVEYDLKPLRDVLTRQYPNNNLRLESVLGQVILSGEAGSTSEGDQIEGLIRRYLAAASSAAGAALNADEIQLANRMSSDGDGQVMLKVRVAEMRRSLVRQLGVNWSEGGGLANVIANGFGANGAALGGLAANIAFNGGIEIDALLRAFEKNSVMRTLAEPVLTATNGETASFLAGGQFAYPSSVENGQIGYSFRDVGVALEFTPVVLNEGRIVLRVATEISELTNEGALTAGDVTIPGLSVRRANTTIELPSGGSMVMAGLLQQRETITYDGLPGIKELPVLGRLFSSSDFLRNETELVILVTAYVVKPGQEQDFNLPTDGFAPASAVDFYLLGRLNAVYGAGAYDQGAAQAAAAAPIGFIME